MIPTNKVSTDNAAVNEAIRETTFRSVKDGVEGTLRSVSYLCTLNRFSAGFIVVKCPVGCESLVLNVGDVSEF